MELLIWMLTAMLRHAARLLPPERREWATAVLTEAGEVPAGARRVTWLVGGLWLVTREAQMVRRMAYGLGTAAAVAAVAGLVWRAWPGTRGDVEISTDRVRVLVLAAALAGLPWVARRRQVFGPVGRSAAARLVRVGGCAALCALVLGIVWIDQTNRDLLGLVGGAHWGDGGNVAPFDPVDWAQEASGLALLAACLAAFWIITARWRGNLDDMWGTVWAATICACLIALGLLVIQMVIILYAAGIYFMTARRSPVPPAALAAGAVAGTAGSLLVYTLMVAGSYTGGWLIFLVAVLAAPAAAGLVAAWWTPATDPPAELNARILQGMAAGIVAGGAAALLITILNGQLFLLLGLPLSGALLGSLGGTIGATRPRKPRRGRSWSGGVFVISS